MHLMFSAAITFFSSAVKMQNFAAFKGSAWENAALLSGPKGFLDSCHHLEKLIHETRGSRIHFFLCLEKYVHSTEGSMRLHQT